MASFQPRVEIVTHCWAGRHRHYAQALCYQLSSLILDPPQHCHVTINVCYDPADADTLRILEWFVNNRYTGPMTHHRRLCFMGIPLPIEQLGRRAIGRNIAAKQTAANLIWFTDCDHVFSDGILDRLAAMTWPAGASMVHPRSIWIHRDHKTGDQATAMISGPMIRDIDRTEFVEKKYNRAIGGVQIVRGDHARKIGYLDGYEKWQQPLDRKTFVSCRCDRAYRSQCQEHGPIIPVDLPGIYRIRHTATTHHEKS